jgi:hypothetical protein
MLSFVSYVLSDDRIPHVLQTRLPRTFFGPGRIRASFRKNYAVLSGRYIRAATTNIRIEDKNIRYVALDVVADSA